MQPDAPPHHLVERILSGRRVHNGPASRLLEALAPLLLALRSSTLGNFSGVSGFGFCDLTEVGADEQDPAHARCARLAAAMASRALL